MKIVVLRNAPFNLNKNNVFTNIHDIWGPRKNQIVNKQNIIEWYRDESSHCRFNSEDDIFLMIGVIFNKFYWSFSYENVRIFIINSYYYLVSISYIIEIQTKKYPKSIFQPKMVKLPVLTPLNKNTPPTVVTCSFAFYLTFLSNWYHDSFLSRHRNGGLH